MFPFSRHGRNPVIDPRGARRYTAEAHTIAAREVEFSWDGVPMHYVPGEVMATHSINFMHLVLPEGERAMSGALAEALPLIEDQRLHEEVVGFVGQEATHASSHEGAREHLASIGLDVEPMVRTMEWLVDNVLSDRGLTGRARHAWLCERLGMFAALEHYTAVAGEWLLHAGELERAGMHPMMLDLVRWHGAEEVEHRNVAFDAFMYVDGSYARRVRTALLASATLAVLYLSTQAYLFRKDPSPGKGRFWFLQLIGTARRGLIPDLRFLVTEIPKYLRPGFHPSQLGSMDAAIRYLSGSPAANAGREGLRG
ncbi:metal-dependent hydrolase [Amycolatopsis antarctica]|uniref:Metal-dependent hydrolase n=1 Tax=Amycolatopsis antarctica TaxID=1854586 RepID=A0A263DAP6_9PSEU|nr:metal-dependent hydrolase [Amycolatopsis antarctica]OZM74455.1 metal-dependent hydrolase [Amycolatopsis antarctica]